jgi:hypothetical protein
MPGPAPKPNRRRRNKPVHGELQATVTVGWQHGPVPEAPDGLLAVSRDAWATWFGAWFASHWTPADLPGLGILIVQYDAVKRGNTKANDVTALVRLMDNYGITHAGQQARRWLPPADAKAKPVDVPEAAKGGRYKHLRAV